MASTPEDFFVAIEAGEVERVRAMLAEEPWLADARDAQGVSALLRARYRSDRAMVAAIVAAGPTLDVFDAAASEDLDRLVVLLDGSPELATATSGDGFAPLHLAAFFGRVEAARLLLARGADPDVRGTGWMAGTPMHSATSGRHADVVRALLDAGADPNARQSGGWTPLHAAAKAGDLASVEALLGAGADPAAVNEEGASVLSLAEVGGDAQTIGLIHEALGG